MPVAERQQESRDNGWLLRQPFSTKFSTRTSRPRTGLQTRSLSVSLKSASGVAPGAQLVSLKVAGPDGATDVSVVIAALQWVVTHRAQYGSRS